MNAKNADSRRAKGQRIPRIEDYIFSEDEFDVLYEDAHPTFREWLQESWTHYLLIPLIPAFYLLCWSMEIGQRISGDRPTGAFPTGCFGAIFGVSLALLIPVIIIILVAV